ncbi:MAG TPA: LytTR family DNA-binding domain-containing protein [Cyclobacteriaceae bacterium]|nr:LytTR family DNA-binding domain-containing protein [Cyclobacteriaceae bacterium]
MYRGFIIEDEKHQMEMLSHLLDETFPELSVVGTASSVPEGIEQLTKAKPDLLFLDVLLPPHTAFDLLNAFVRIPFDIIFTTSFEEYAVKAFRLSAVDYLVKPIVKSELISAIEKFKQRRSAAEASLHLHVLMENLKVTEADHTKIALPSLTGYLFVSVKDIIRCESDNTYTTFFTTDKRKIIVSKTLKECEQMLGEYRFYRVHNSHLINLEYMVEYIKGEGGIVKMADGSHIDVSRRRKEDFMHILKKV